MFGVLLSLILKLKKSKVDKVLGKELSTNDFTDSLKTKLESLNSYKLITTEKILIIGNKITLPTQAFGDCIFNMAKVFDDLDNQVYYEFSCIINTSGEEGIFDIEDNLDKKYAIISYLTFRG